MEQIRSILMVAGNQNNGNTTLMRAASMAKQFKARLTVAEIIEDLPWDVRAVNTDLLPLDMVEFFVDWRRALLKRFVEPARQAGIHVRTKLFAGAPYLEITQEVAKENHDLVIMNIEESDEYNDWKFGRASIHLMYDCPCPILVSQPRLREESNRILTVLDPQGYDNEPDSLNGGILDLAATMARLEGAELHLVDTLPSAGNPHLRNHFRFSGRGRNEINNGKRRDHQRKLEALLAARSMENIGIKIHFLKTETQSHLTRLAREKRADMVVMGTVCQTGIKGFFIGNVAEELLKKARCSILVAQPNGFVARGQRRKFAHA